MNLNNLAQEIHKNAVDKGFYDKELETGTLLMLVVTELSEALESDRIGKYTEYKKFHDNIENDFNISFEKYMKDTFEDELADVIIRVLDICAHKSINIDNHVKYKMLYNLSREPMHGKKY